MVTFITPIFVRVTFTKSTDISLSQGMHVNVVLKQSCYVQSHNSENSYAYRYLSIICGWIFICFTGSAEKLRPAFCVGLCELDLCRAGMSGVGTCVPGSGHRFCDSGAPGSAASHADTPVYSSIV